LDIGLLSLQHRSLLIGSRTLSWLEVYLPVSIISHEGTCQRCLLYRSKNDLGFETGKRSGGIGGLAGARGEMVGT